MRTLVIAEHTHQSLLSATHKTVTAATQVGNPVDIIVLGHQCQGAADQATTIEGVENVYVADDQAYEHFIAENIAKQIVALADNYSHILVPSATFGKNILPRVAALLDVSQVTDVIEILSENSFKRPIYAGNAIATVESSDAKKLLTIRTTAFAAAAEGNSASIQTTDSTGDTGQTKFVKMDLSEGDGPDLSSARIVISGGRGLGSAEDFKILDSLAEKLPDCAIGASRAAVDAGYAPNDYQVGQTGKIVAPELYIAFGISGAIQHLAGMKDSKVIVAVNKDENAPIFEIADYGLVADLFDVIPELKEALS
jgi:electron transfer flavoprotein alpha subunit